MRGLESRARIAVALGLVLVLGSIGELPHGHVDEIVVHQPHAAQVFPPQTVSEGETICPVCVLQRLLGQAETASFNALEKPDATGSIAPSPAPRIAGSATRTGSPRGPPAGL